MDENHYKTPLTILLWMLIIIVGTGLLAFIIMIVLSVAGGIERSRVDEISDFTNMSSIWQYTSEPLVDSIEF